MFMSWIGLPLYRMSKMVPKWFLSQCFKEANWYVVNFHFQEESAVTLRQQISKLLEASSANSLTNLQFTANSAVSVEYKVISTHLFNIIKYP